MRSKARTLFLVMALGALGAVPARRDEGLGFHFALRESAPAADSSVPSPSEIRLWFTQVPQENSVSVRLVDPAGNAVETGALASDVEDGRVLFVPIERVLPAGGYTVAWRGIGDDGHVVRGEFAFTVTTLP